MGCSNGVRLAAYGLISLSVIERETHLLLSLIAFDG